MELIFWSQYSPQGKTKLGPSEWRALRLSSPQEFLFYPGLSSWWLLGLCVWWSICVKRPVFSLSFVQREVQGRDWKLTTAWSSCWGRSAKREARLPSAHIPLTQSLLSLGIIGGTLSLGFSLSKSHRFPRPNSRPCSLMMPCWAPSPPWTPLAYVFIQTALRSSFTHGCCTSLLLSTGMENSRRWRLSWL